MRGLADVRVLVLTAPGVSAERQTDLDLLDRRLTIHTLHVTPRGLPILLLRLGKRLAMAQDDLIVMVGLPSVVSVPIKLLARLWRQPLLSIGKSARKDASTHEKRLLQAIARTMGRSWPQAGEMPLRLDVGCGSQVRPGFLGIDARRTRATAIVSDARSIAVRDAAADEVYASCLLEHFDDPHQVLREIHRVLRPDGQAVLRLPNLGTYSSHLDTTHRFLADLALWRRILGGYFMEVQVVPVGTKYRDNPWLVRVNWLLVNVLGWHELAQGWDFICRRPKATPSIEYTGWWEE